MQVAKPIARVTGLLVILLLFFSSSVLASETFQQSFKAHSLVLDVEQAYSEDGLSQPSVRINGAVLRSFSLMQRIDIVHNSRLMEGASSERVVVLYHWDGATGCGGSLTVLSLSAEGFFQSQPLGQCVEEFDIIRENDGDDYLKISLFADEAKTTISQSWRYWPGFIVAD